MEQELEKKINFVEKLKNFYIKQKKKIFFFIFILLAILISAFFIKNNQSKKNVLISEKYIQAGVYLSAGKRDEAIFIYKDIISTKNNFYSILSLNTIIDKDLISDKSKILEYFKILENASISEENKDLLTLKKGLYLIKKSDLKNGHDLLKKLIEKNSKLKPIAEQLINK